MTQGVAIKEPPAILGNPFEMLGAGFPCEGVCSLPLLLPPPSSPQKDSSRELQSFIARASAIKPEMIVDLGKGFPIEWSTKFLSSPEKELCCAVEKKVSEMV